jgi:aspartyl-tRNA synthetase
VLCARARSCGGGDEGLVLPQVGPVFRAENSNTHRHLCEFTGLDFEMAFNEHYYEVLQVMSDLFIYIFDQLNVRFRAEIEAVRAQHPFEDLKYCRPSLRITFQEGIKLLQDAGFNASPNEDLTTELEKALGKIVKEKFDTDFYMMDKYPLSVSCLTGSTLVVGDPPFCACFTPPHTLGSTVLHHARSGGSDHQQLVRPLHPR